MFCSKCGTLIENPARFCSKCGTPVAPPQQQPVPPMQQPATPGVPQSAQPLGASPAPPQQPVPAQAPGIPQPAPAQAPDVPQPAQPLGAQPVPPQATGQFGAQPPYATTPPIAPPKKKKSKKPLIIIICAVVLVILVIAGIFVAQAVQRANDYEQAVAYLDAGEFEQAYDEFIALGDYEDSTDLAGAAIIGIDYLNAKELFDNGEYESAKSAFQVLANIYYADAAEWVDKCDYAIAEGKYNIADEKYNAGDHYGAYEDFILLGDFLDAPARAESCADPLPDTGELYHNDGYISSASRIVIDGKNSLSSNYFKIYEGDTLVSSLFINGGGTVSINIPAGNYTLKQASGRLWFGEEIMFGDEGYYEVLIFEDGASSTRIDRNIEFTLSLHVTDGNTDSDIIGREGF